ncbi:hypothetical protein [Alkanindiges illinoisensis]|uniref:hypothetical protein n=1 Tax=Alkanindiges illinoisensis TaxID=197183 RepID=UPI0012EC08ED|nr:hypothetical protein [Alkanindiges illinoisensis]
MLSPANDNQTNMRLLMADMRLATIAPPKPPVSSWTDEYSAVPFAAEDFKNAISNTSPSQRKKSSSQKSSDRYIAEERCQSSASGMRAFIEQVNADRGLKPAEKLLLIKQRQAILPSCDKALEYIKVIPEWSSLVKQYISYINGSVAFYNSDYPTAQKIYTALNSVPSAWLSETATYMLIRTSVNHAYSSGLDEYGFQSLAKIDKNAIATSFNAIGTYFKRYPQGQYAASARGLLRRLYWMGGQQQQLIDEFLWQFNHLQKSQFNLEMQWVPEEIDQRIFESKLFNPSNLKDPFFLATYDLMHMRESSAEKYKPLSWTALQAQKDYFKTAPELYRYLQAAHLFLLQKKPQQALDYLPKGNPPDRLNYLQLSQFVLKGRILEHLSKSDEANTLWTVLLGSAKSPYQPQLVELALALNLQNGQDINAFFKTDSLIKDPAIRAVMIRQAANAELLDSIINSSATSAQEKLLASFTLLHKSLNHQQYKLFVDSLKYLPKDAFNYKGYDSETEALKNQPKFELFLWKGTAINDQLSCPSLINISKTLTTQPQDEVALLCLGEFVRLSSFKSGEYNLEPEMPNQNTSNRLDWALGNGQIPFAQATFSRGEVYKNIIQNSANDHLKAYALYRAINCYAPGGINDCAGVDVEKSLRKKWFEQLKQNYPDSQWAKELTYYW